MLYYGGKARAGLKGPFVGFYYWGAFTTGGLFSSLPSTSKREVDGRKKSKYEGEPLCALPRLGLKCLQ